MMRWAACIALGACPSLLAAGCIAVSGERILARDLAQAWPEILRAAPADAPLAYAPIPGARRTFDAGELARLSARWSVALEGLHEVCFERSMQALSRERVTEVLRAALHAPEATLEVLEFSRQPVPAGVLEFPRDGLAAGAATLPDAALLWRGRVVYDGNRRCPVWARVRIRVPQVRVTAAVNLEPGQPLRSDGIRIQPIVGFPLPDTWPAAADLEGRVPRHRIPAGATITARDLDAPGAVQRGDMLEIEVRSGSARLTFTGRAEAAGRPGDRIPVRNLDSGKSFQARVTGPGRALVTAAGSPLQRNPL